MHWGTALFTGVVLTFAAAFWLMLLLGVVHGFAPAVPAIGYWKSFVIGVLYAGFHNGATWPGHNNIEDL